MTKDSLESMVRDLARDGRAWVELAVVDVVEPDSDTGVMLLCTLVPGGDQVMARLAVPIGGQTGEGDWGRLEQGAEVLLLLPGGDRNRAVAIAGPTSGMAGPPSGWAGDGRQILDRDGMDVRATDGATTVPAVTASLLTDLKASISEMRTALLGLGVASLPQTDTLLAAIDTSYRAVLRAEETT